MIHFPSRRIKITSFFLTISTLIFLISGCTKEVEEKVIVRNVHVDSPTLETIDKSINSFGKLTSNKTVKISTQVTGIITKNHFTEGSHVEKGDLLISIDPSEYEAQLSLNQAMLERDLKDYEIKKYLVEKHKPLVEKNAMAENEYQKEVAEMASAYAQTKMDEANIRLDEINLGYCEITSPISGVISDIKINAGNLVKANSDEVLTTIKQVNPLYVDFTIPESFYTKLKEAMEDKELKVILRQRQKAALGTEDIGEYTATLDFLDNTINPNTGTISLRATVQNDDLKLWPGQMVNIDLVLGELEDAILVPTKAVRIGKTGDYVFLATPENTAKIVYVDTGKVNIDQTPILSDNINESDKIITIGLSNLTDGSLINVIKDESVKENEDIDVNEQVDAKVQETQNKQEGVKEQEEQKEQ